MDPGNPVGPAKTIAAGGAVTDGGGSNPISGYTVITAGDMDAAVDAAKGCPVLAGGRTVEVCETFEVM